MAVKIAKLTARNQDSVLKEIQVLCSAISHSNILQCYFAERVMNRKVITVLEMWQYDLEHCIRKKTYPITKENICRQISSGIYFLHKNNIFHGNLQPSNIFVVVNGANTRIKLSGFGLPMADKLIGVECTKHCWIPPEVLKCCYNMDAPIAQVSIQYNKSVNAHLNGCMCIKTKAHIRLSSRSS